MHFCFGFVSLCLLTGTFFPDECVEGFAVSLNHLKYFVHSGFLLWLLQRQRSGASLKTVTLPLPDLIGNQTILFSNRARPSMISNQKVCLCDTRLCNIYRYDDSIELQKYPPLGFLTVRE